MKVGEKIRVSGRTDEKVIVESGIVVYVNDHLFVLNLGNYNESFGISNVADRKNYLFERKVGKTYEPIRFTKDYDIRMI